MLPKGEIEGGVVALWEFAHTAQTFETQGQPRILNVYDLSPKTNQQSKIKIMDKYFKPDIKLI